MSERPFDLLIAGELNPDAIVLAETIEPEYRQVERVVDDGVLTIGSSGAIVACGAARLGMRVAYVGVVGDDASGRFMLRELRGREIDVEGCRVDPARATGLTVVLSKGRDRAILTALGAMRSLTAADVTDEMLAAARHLHVSSPHLQIGLRDGLAELFSRAREAGASTSLDPGWDPSGGWTAGLEGALDATDIFLPNAAEACAFAGVEDPEAALDLLAERIDTVAVKLGAEGAIATHGELTAKADAPSIEPVDGTGAGDSFAAGFLHGLAGERSLKQALRLGVACGSLSTRSLGGVDAQPLVGEALQFAERVAYREIERSGTVSATRRSRQ
jgi:sugar/nucleoside kinase (ribokinase family)